jgi:3-hydroxybutyryl-CoA dehydrogenase
MAVSISEITKVGVLGAGQMGNGIAQVCAAAGLKVQMVDVSEAQLEKGKATISASCDRLVKKEQMTVAQKEQLLSLVTTSTQLSSLSDCQVTIEAATENIELKLKIFADLDRIAAPTAYLVSNTSSISITKIAAATKRPHLVCGMHFMNPVPLMKLVEGIRGLQTSDETFAVTRFRRLH